MSRLHFMEWQRGELQSWLEIRNIPIRRGHDGDTVDKEAFETAFLEEFPQHAREAQAQSETLRRHPARRGGYQKIDDEPVLMELRLEIEHDPSRSLRRAILDRADDLAGHTPEAKIRRITKKYKKKYGSEK